MASITVLGGAGEIGGNKILIRDRDTSVFLDFGMSLGARSAYFSDPYVSPRSERSLLDLGIIPRVNGFYRWEKSTEVDGVLLSHAHLDHYGYLSMMNREIPVYCGETTKIQMEAIAETRRGGLESDYKGIVYRTFRSGSRLQVGSLKISPVHVDHSLPGAHGFIVETGDGVAVYTGDIRVHGRNSAMSRDFASAAARAAPELMITEATNLVSGEVSSEIEVGRKLKDLVGRAKGLVAASFSTMDTDRLLSFHEAAEENERRLVLSMRQAYFLMKLRKELGAVSAPLKDGQVLVYRRQKKRYERWEEEVCSSLTAITADEIAENQSKYILAAGLADMEAILDVRPEPGSIYVLSSSEPFNEEMELDMERLISWLDRLGMPRYHVHVSGHIMPQDLRELLLSVSPRKIVPVHTEYPGLFGRFFGREEDVLVPVKGESIAVS